MLLVLLAATWSTAQAQPNDPYLNSSKSWKQSHGDQWGLASVGLGHKNKAVWTEISKLKRPVIVAVIDTGLDYFHPDLNQKNIWHNPRETKNGLDDDDNGYVDDLIGWNFYDNNNNPWDRTGHGTFVAGIIGAASNNRKGIAGISGSVQIMPLKALNFIGRGRTSGIASAIFYAVENGARVINLSLGGHHVSAIEQKALDYAVKKDVLVVVAAGNEAIESNDYGMATHPGVIAVAATGIDSKRAKFSNWGEEIDIAAPGFDILSLRARRTDFSLAAGAVDYRAADAFVGKQAQYYRASGTSFSAPFVSGTAALLFSKHPQLSAVQARNILLQSARDIEVPGKDQYSGHGLLDIPAALASDPDFFLLTDIIGVSVIQIDGAPYLQVNGTADSNRLKRAWLEFGEGDTPDNWQKVKGELTTPARDATLGRIPALKLQGSKVWTIRVIAEHSSGKQSEYRYRLNLN